MPRATDEENLRAMSDMILALGSLLTKRRENAYRVGFIVHTSASLGFARCSHS